MTTYNEIVKANKAKIDCIIVNTAPNTLNERESLLNEADRLIKKYGRDKDIPDADAKRYLSLLESVYNLMRKTPSWRRKDLGYCK